jgi:large subunit ribosomal protein L4
MNEISVKQINFETESVDNKSFSIDSDISFLSAKNISYVVRWQLASRRSGSAKTKTMSEISGTTAKPWKQKGTGRARQGSKRSVQFVGGRTCHGPMPRSFDFSMPKKITKKALADVITLKIFENKIFTFSSPSVNIKTNKISKFLQKSNLETVLFIVDKNSVLQKSVKNIKNVKVLHSNALNVYDILNYNNVIVEQNIFEQSILKSI